MIQYINGDIFSTDCDVICHQTNCRGRWGSGIAVDMKKRFPKAYNAYSKHCKISGNKLLGCIQPILCEDAIVMNLFGQDGYGREKIKYTDYDALDSCFKKAHDYCSVYNYTIAVPYKIGCGYGNGDWNVVLKIIKKYFEKSDITCVIYKKED